MPSPAGQRRRQCGFTLIELLVVISIIALLVAILLPALAKAKVAAQVAGCASNLKQVTIGIYAYAGENTERYPDPWIAEKVDATDTICGRRHDAPWPAMLNSLVKAPIGTWGPSAQGRSYTGLPVDNVKNAFTCPQPRPGWSLFSGVTTWASGGTYTMNPMLWQRSIVNPGVFAGSHNYTMAWSWSYYAAASHSVTRVADTRYTSTTIAVGDGYTWYNMWASGTFTAHSYPFNNQGLFAESFHPSPAGRGNYRWQYHAGLGNTAFLDGHVRGITSARIQELGLSADQELYRMTKDERATGILW